MKTRYHIPRSLYKKILRVMPNLAVDVVLVHRGTFLLLRRAIPPRKGEWWIPGGRVVKGESPEKSAKNKIYEETGVRVRLTKLLGVDSIYERRWGIRVQTCTFVYLARPIKSLRIRTNFNNKEYQWFKKVNPAWHSYVKKFVRLAGFL